MNDGSYSHNINTCVLRNDGSKELLMTIEEHTNRQTAINIAEILRDDCEPVYGNMDAFGVVYQDSIELLIKNIEKALDAKDGKK